jgi:hypothetical protein
MKTWNIPDMSISAAFVLSEYPGALMKHLATSHGSVHHFCMSVLAQFGVGGVDPWLFNISSIMRSYI